MSTFFQHVVDAVSRGSLYAMFALGITLVFGVMRLVNFAYGALVMAGGYAFVVVGGESPVVKLLLALAVVVVLSVVLERVAFRPLRNAPPTTLLVTSFAVGSFLIALAQAVFGSTARFTIVSNWLTKHWEFDGVFVTHISVLNIVISAVAITLLVVFLRRTRIGLQMRAAADNFRMARAFGVRANSVVLGAFVVSGLLSALASFMFISQGGSVFPSIGTSPLLYAFVATILGGIGSVQGAIIGGYMLGITSEVLEATLPSGLVAFRDAFVFAAIFVLLVMRPEGITGSRGFEERV